MFERQLVSHTNIQRAHKWVCSSRQKGGERHAHFHELQVSSVQLDNGNQIITYRNTVNAVASHHIWLTGVHVRMSTFKSHAK